MDSASLSLGLTPHGRLALIPDDDAPPLGPGFRERLQQAFHRGSGHGLLLLGADEAGASLPPVVSYWREFGTRYVTALCTQQNDDASHRKGHVAVLPDEELEGTVSAGPPMSGGEYLTAAVLRSLWLELDRAFAIELSKSKCDVQEFLKRRNPAWNLVGRVHFNLAENRKEPETPFAFLATYTTRLSARDKAQHLPLAQALREYAGGPIRTASYRFSFRCSAPRRRAPGSRLWSMRARSFIRCAGHQTKHCSSCKTFRGWKRRAW